MIEFDFEKTGFINLLSKIYDSLKADKLYTITVKEKRKKRSLDSNAYFWVLTDKIAKALTIKNQKPVTKEEVYFNQIKNINDNFDYLCIQEKAVDDFVRRWEANGLGWFCETLPSKIDNCVTVFAYYGSSCYDTEQMSQLIDSTVQDCKALGIETMPPAELERLLNAWGGK